MFLLATGVVFLAVASVVRVSEPAVQQHSSHTNNWAVLVSCDESLPLSSSRALTRVTTQYSQVCASRYWFNYRHVANTLSIYRSVKRLGIPDRFVATYIRKRTCTYNTYIIRTYKFIH